MVVRFGALRLSGCESLRVFCCIRQSSARQPTPQRITLDSECNFACFTPTTICAGTPRTTLSDPQLAKVPVGKDDLCHRGLGSILDQTSPSSVRPTVQPVSTLFLRSWAQPPMGQLRMRTVMSSRLPASWMRSLCSRGGGDDSAHGRGRSPGSFRTKHFGQLPEERSTRRKQTRLHRDFGDRLHPDLQRCETLDDWCDFINANANQLEAANIAGAFKALVRLKRYGGRNEQLRSPLSRLSERASAIAGEMTANQIGDIFWVHGKVRIQMHEQLWETLSGQAVASAEEFSPKNVANTVWSLAKGKRRCRVHRELVDVMSEQAIRVADEFNPQNVANLMWAYAAMGLRAEAGLVSAMSAQAIREADDFNPQHISNLMWAFATMGLKAEPKLVEAMGGRAVRTAHDFKPQNIANLMWALATMGLAAEAGLVEAMSRRAMRTAEEFTHQNVANLMWAIATMGSRAEGGLLSAMSERAVRGVSEFDAQAMANLMWALATMGVKAEGRLADAMSSQAVRAADTFTAHGVASLMWAFATMDLKAETALVDAMSERATTIAAQFEPQGVSNLMWAFATMELRAAAGLVEAMSRQAVRGAREFEPQAVANLMWALATMGLRAEAELVEAMSARALERADAFKPQAVAILMWACATMGLEAAPELVEAMSRQAVRGASEFTAQAVANLMWALSVLDEKALFVVFEDCDSFLAHSHADWTPMHLRQLHQASITIDLSTEPASTKSASLRALMAETSDARNAAWRSVRSSPSRTQGQVAGTLGRMGLGVREEVTDEASGYSLDIVLDRASPRAPAHVGQCAAGWAVEVDGPSHFVRSSDGALHCNGGTLLKRRHLAAQGYALVPLPFWEWDAVYNKNPEDRVKYLSEKLGLRPALKSGVGVGEGSSGDRKVREVEVQRQRRTTLKGRKHAE